MKKALSYCIPPILVMGIMFMVFAQKDIYPFGSQTVDWIDMGQLNAAMYHHLYDAMHGTKSLFFDWYTALGMNMSEIVMNFSYMSPFNLFFYFVDRDMILQSLAYFTIIKMMAMSLSMYFFLNRVFKIHNFWKTLFALGYAFCGYVVQYYTNSNWLDIAAVFPLLVLAGLYLFRKNKYVPYCLALTGCLVMNFYLTCMIMLFLFFIGGLYIIMLVPEQNRRKVISLFGVSTVIAMALSAAVVLPGYMQMSQSARFEQGQGGFNFLLNIMNTVDGNSVNIWYILIGAALSLVIIVYGIVKTRKSDKKVNMFLILSILLIGTPLYFENINLIWHAGSYVGFPVRFGYMITFVLYCAASYYISKIDSFNVLNNEPWFQKTYIKIAYIGVSLLMLPIGFKVLSRLYQKDIYGTEMLSILTIIFILFCTAYFMILNKRNRFVNYRAVAVFALAGMITSAYLFMPPNENAYWRSPERTSDYIGTSNILKEKLPITGSSLDRIKNPGNTLNSNYPLIMKRAALSNWTHTISSHLQRNYTQLGYSIVFTRLLDSGGTVFSDALLNVKQTLTTGELDTRLYTPAGNYDNYTLYDHKYRLPFGITAYDSIADVGYGYSNSFEFQNALFEGLSQEGPLITMPEVSYTITDDKKERSQVACVMSISGEKVLYFQPQKELSDISFTIDGKELVIPTIGSEDNTTYPTLFSSNILDLGVYADTTVHITISCPKIEEADEYFTFALLDLEKLERFTNLFDSYVAYENAASRSVSLTATGTQEKNILFLPITYDPGWTCTINGKTAEITPLAGTFVGVRLLDGVNEVELIFWPQGLSIGIWISVLTLFFCLLGIILRFLYKVRFKQNETIKHLVHLGIPIKNIFCTVTEKAFYVLWGIGVVAVYVVPIAYAFIMRLI